LTEDVIVKSLLVYPASSSSRTFCYIAYNALLKFANVKNSLKKYKTEYKTKVLRELPSDSAVVEIVNKVPDHWRWTFGMLATYGLRGHELRSLDCSRMKDEPHIIYVSEKTKTGHRAVYPVLPEWVNKWELYNVNLPPINVDINANIKYGTSLSQNIGKILDRIGYEDITAYHFRDAYAVRCSLVGIDAVVSAKWMGHSLKEHWDSYLKFFDEVHHKQAWDKVFGKNQN
jgi:integrase